MTLLYVDLGGEINNLQVRMRAHIHINYREIVDLGLLGDRDFVQGALGSFALLGYFFFGSFGDQSR